MNYNGEKFLDILYKDLYKSKEVLRTKEKSDTKEESIAIYLNRLERIHNRANTDYKKNLIKELYYHKYIIEEENIPNYINDNEKENIINDQKKSLDLWIDYLSSNDAMYPLWAKYWIFQQILKIGTYNEMSGKYTKRNKTTRNSFIELNPEIVAKCIENITKLLGNEKKSTQEIRKLVRNISFEKMYLEYQEKYKDNYKSHDGVWVKYNKGNIEEARKLAKSLQGYNTKWCTASELTAISQVKSGDFYVYYTLDENNEYKVPRIAIRLNGSKHIGEIRGVKGYQDLEDEMISVLEKKLKEMEFLSKKDVNEYMEKIEDIQEKNQIKEKIINKKELNSQEIFDLYTKEFSFGWERDSLIEQLKSKRNILNDYEKIKDFDSKSVDCFIQKNLNLFNDKKYILDDKNLILKLVKHTSFFLRYASSEIKNDREFMLQAIKINYHYLNDIDDQLKKDEKFMLQAIKINENSFAYVDNTLKYNKNFVIKALKINPNLIKIAYNKNINPKYLKNREVILNAIKSDPKLIKYADYDLRTNKKFILKNVKVYPKLFRYLPDDLRKNKKFVLAGIKKNPSAGLYYSILQLQTFLDEASMKLSIK